MKVILLSSTKYKEKDGIIDAITENGPVSFYGKGIYNPTAKNHPLTNGLLIADIETVAGTEKPAIIRRSKILVNPRTATSSYYTMSAILLLAEITKKCVFNEDYKFIYPHLEAAIISLCDSNYPWHIVLVYLAKILQINGYELEVKACVNCGTKTDINSFSFQEGGFLCRTCASYTDLKQDLTADQLRLVHDIFVSRDYVHVSPECTKENAAVLLRKFYEFIADVLGTKLSNISLFYQ